MPTTPDLNITHISASQNQKDVTANAAFDQLDVAIAGSASVDCTAGGTITLDSLALVNNYKVWGYRRLKLTGTPSAAFTIVVPLTYPKEYIVDNQSGQAATVKGATGTGISVAAADVQSLYCDGTNVIALGLPSSGGVSSITLAGDVTGASGSNTLSKFNGVPWSSGSAAPTTGAHVIGEIVWNSAPTADGFIGWVCVTSGTPGTWIGFGLIAHS